MSKNHMELNTLSLLSCSVQVSILTLGFFANLLLIIAHRSDPLRVFKNPISLFVRYIAIIDVNVTIWWTIRLATVLIFQRKFEMVSFIWLGLTTLSPNAFLCFSIERYLSVAFPLWYRVHVTVGVCRKVLLSSWFAHVVMCILVQIVLEENDAQFFIYGIRLSYLSASVAFAWPHTVGIESLSPLKI